MVSKGTAARLMSESFHPLYKKRFTLTMATMSRKRFEELSEKRNHIWKEAPVPRGLRGRGDRITGREGIFVRY